MDGGFVIHLASNGSRAYSLENTADVFTNQLQNPIHLDINEEYEIALVNIQTPKILNIISKKDDDCRIDLYKHDEKTIIKIAHFIPSMDITGNDIYMVEKMINKDFKDFIKKTFNLDLKGQFKFRRDHNRFTLKWKVEDEANGKYCIVLGARLAHVLGFPSNTYIPINGELDAPAPTNSNGDIQYMVVYSDIVKPSHFAEQEVNVLDIFSVGMDGNRGFHNIIYKPLNTHRISSISIKLTDQAGRSLSFPRDSVSTCSLHIRKKRL